MDEDDSEEPGRETHLLGFLFGNVDDSGDLDADYLDEDAKEHLSALAGKLGPPLSEIAFAKSSPTSTDPAEQDYDQKAEDAVDYEDIDEEYDGPELEAAAKTESLFSEKEHFSSNVQYAVGASVPLFDEENYDEEEGREDIGVAVNMSKSHHSGEEAELVSQKETSSDRTESPLATHERVIPLDADSENLLADSEKSQEYVADKRHMASGRGSSLPVLFVEDGVTILRFSQIFGVHEPQRKTRKDCHKRVPQKERTIALSDGEAVEEDEEIFLRSEVKDFSACKYAILTPADYGDDDMSREKDLEWKDSCLPAQPMKCFISEDKLLACNSPFRPDIYSLDLGEWENEIIWGNSPALSYESNLGVLDETTDGHQEGENNVRGLNSPVFDESSNCRGGNALAIHSTPPSRSSSFTKKSRDKRPSYKGSTPGREVRRDFSKLSLLNKEFLDGSWLDKVIWDLDDGIAKPKLILNLQDDRMLFEVSDDANIAQHKPRAAAMIMIRPSNSSMEDNGIGRNHTMELLGQFNISNDNPYANKKESQQVKTHAKKHASVKILHSIPALKLQTIKAKLSNKEIANFHRPKALWYPRENKLITKLQKKISSSNGTFDIILWSLGGKKIKLGINTEDNVLSVKSKATKKLEFGPSENVKFFYSGKVLEENMSLATQGLLPNSVLHFVRTTIHLWPRAQKLPGENKPLRPPGAFKRKSDLSVKDGHLFLMEYCEERPLILNNNGMGARICTYYQKASSSDQTALSLRNVDTGMGSVLALEPGDKSPFIGNIGVGHCQSCLTTNMFRAPIFQHKVAPTDYILVRSPKGTLSLRRFDKIYVVGQQEPLMEVLSPVGAKNIKNYLSNRMLVYVYRELFAKEESGSQPSIGEVELLSQFPNMTVNRMRSLLKEFANPKKSYGQVIWVKKPDFRLPTEGELRQTLSPEDVCCYESMQAGLYRLKHLGIQRLTLPTGLLTAMNRLPDEAITLAAASHIERELQITAWNLTGNFIACIKQRDTPEKLQITGVGDPSGRGLGFSYVRMATKAPASSSVVKKKGASNKASAVTGTDADLRRLSMDAAREVLLKFNVPLEIIEKQTRWHRIALVRKLSSERAAAGAMADAMQQLSKFARGGGGQRLTISQTQQQTKEKCQEIWDRQAQSLAAADGDGNGSDSEANSDLDSFAGDLENLLDAEELEEEDASVADSRVGIKMRRCSFQALVEEEMEDDKDEAADIIRMLKESGNERKKKKADGMSQVSHLDEKMDLPKKVKIQQIGGMPLVALSSRESWPTELNEISTERSLPTKLHVLVSGGTKDDAVLSRQSTLPKDGVKEKKYVDRRETFACGACGQLGHMRTNKNCPKFGLGLDQEAPEPEGVSGRWNPAGDGTNILQAKKPVKKLVPKVPTKVSNSSAVESVTKSSTLPVKFICGTTDKTPEKALPPSPVFVPDRNVKDSSGKVNRIVISTSKSKAVDTSQDIPKPSVVIIPPAYVEQEQPRKKITIKQPKVLQDPEPLRQTDFLVDRESRKMKKIDELPMFEQPKEWDLQTSAGRSNEPGVSSYTSRLRIRSDNKRQASKERAYDQEDEQSLYEDEMYDDADRVESRRQKSKIKKRSSSTASADYTDEYDQRLPYRTASRRVSERDHRLPKRRAAVDEAEYVPPSKRRRGGEVELSNILETIVDSLRAQTEVSLLFLKPVTKKEAPDYFDIVKQPMDLSTIRDKVRKMEYRNRDEFRHDMCQIVFNAHLYNDGRNPGIPPLADQLLELCDFLLHQNRVILSEAEALISSRN